MIFYRPGPDEIRKLYNLRAGGIFEAEVYTCLRQ